jgi:hypothetical protein
MKSPAYLAAPAALLCLILGSNASFAQIPCQGGQNYSSAIGQELVPAGVGNIGNHGDDLMTTIVMAFGIVLYNQPLPAGTLVHLSSNGNVQVQSSNPEFDNQCLPFAPFNWAIMPFWDDLHTGANPGCAVFPNGLCGIFTATTGVAPNRFFHMEWRAVRFDSPTTSVNFEVRLHEADANFEITYGALSGGGAFATAGVQRDTGSLFTQFACNTSLPSNTTVYYTCPLVPVELMGFSIE